MCSTPIHPSQLLLLLALCSQDAIYEERGSDWSHQVSAVGTTRWLQRDQTLPLSAKVFLPAQCSCINPPCTAAELETSVLQDSSQLKLHFRELRIFPFLNFSYHGNLTKWTLLAAKGNGQGRPQLSVWRQISATQYRKVAADLMNPCVIRRFSMLDGAEVLVHENVPSEPLSFQPGDILGLLLRGAHAASYIPFLRNNSKGVTDPPLSYYVQRLGSREDDVFTVRKRNSDNLVPVSAFEICVSEDKANTEHPLCTTSQEQQSRACLDINAAVTPTSTATPSPSPSMSVKAPSTDQLSTGLLAASIAVPLCVLVIVLIVSIIVTSVVCGACGGAKEVKEHHMAFTTKPFSEVNTVMEMRYSPPNKPLPSPPPPSPPLRKTDLEPVYEIIA